MNVRPCTATCRRAPLTARTAHHRHGFTLMELLLALMLCGMVLSAAFGAVHLSWKYRSAGEAQVEQSQVVRGVLQDITLDLRSGSVPPAPMDDEEKLTDVAGLPDHIAAAFKALVRKEASQIEGLSNIEERVLEFDSIDQVDPVHFYGEREFFVVLTASPNYRFVASNEVGRVRSPLSHAVWWWNSGQAIRVPFSIRNDQVQRRTLSGDPEHAGLVRVRQDFDARSSRSVMGSRSGTIGPDDGHWTSIIPDAHEVSFRYSDGIEWKASWNSHVTQTLPSAVEFNLVRKQDMVEHRFVIRLPQVTAQAADRTSIERGTGSP
jgi:prepilin-type N-terminal cleavage/methylation domain-containing protein